jgi:hypothetical protein
VINLMQFASRRETDVLCLLIALITLNRSNTFVSATETECLLRGTS